MAIPAVDVTSSEFKRNAYEYYAALRADAPVLERNMLYLDPPDHTRLRGLVHLAFTLRPIERMRKRVPTMRFPSRNLRDAWDPRCETRSDAIAWSSAVVAATAAPNPIRLLLRAPEPPCAEVAGDADVQTPRTWVAPTAE